MSKKLAVLAALTSVMSAQALDMSETPLKGQERCFGIALAGQNDCGNAVHQCAGEAKTDKDPKEWKRVAVGTCTKLGGKLSAADTKKDAPTKKN